MPYKIGQSNPFINKDFDLNIKNIGREAAFDFRVHHTNIKVNLESMKSYNVKSYNKYMGEKYNPHNYKIDSYCQ